MPASNVLKGAIHIHSRYSDGSGKIADIISAAQSAGLDYLIITDHNKLLPEQRAFQGRHGNLLVICGVELKARRFGKYHFLALGVDSDRPYRGLDFPERLARIRDDGGITIIAHPAGAFKTWLALAHRRWQSFPDAPFHGLEIWTYLHDWVRGLRLGSLRRQYRDPDRSLRGPDARLLAQWDALNLRRRVAGIAAQDNHARYVPLFGVRVFPYEYLFRRLLTHVETGPLTNDAEGDIRRLLAAIAAGESYLANNGLAAADGFRFFAQTTEGERGAGAWLENGAETLRVFSPQKAELKIVRSGETILTENTDALELRDPPPGAYRVEARLDGSPWVFTNHINIGMSVDGAERRK